MRKQLLFALWGLLGSCLFFGGDSLCGQGLIVTNRSPLKRLVFTTEAYKTEAFRLLLKEANSVAFELQLSEHIPITETNLTETFILPYGAAASSGAIGDVATSNYYYFCSQGMKFSDLAWVQQERAPHLWIRDYLWPTNRIDTNAAYQLATQWLGEVSMDVAALNRDCDLKITPSIITTGGTNTLFMPIYWINWTKGGWGHGSVAYVELFLPKKIPMQLCVEDPKYIRRKSLIFTNLDSLLSSP